MSDLNSPLARKARLLAMLREVELDVDYAAAWPGTMRAVDNFVAKTGLKLMGAEWKWLD